MYATRIMRLQATRPYFSPAPKENHSAHTISQRLRNLKKIPPELIPLGVVLAVALGAAGYSLTNKLLTDKTLRLYRNSPEQREH
ncbi:uncharacterized protein ASPGLDRAFT_38948 [Aspergillus glaucus CBS 516.65]|uniref:NADH-ubiquinone reductase complex 1 MLRQ subunit n=1 Tax=Aspergillus glaucus CBS 516.65 TaxID=1160497 RepID=A0A1L9V9H8_ASPGL|nr:hypothetical protein ASPGLDRAFT_38948 [Aspergillus glaucus CBS 516.65]OJJ80584.1 hypothetical protein ASPGLDRAFT_38948 [Aspergillus glaucus CBS 516.65]